MVFEGHQLQILSTALRNGFGNSANLTGWLKTHLSDQKTRQLEGQSFDQQIFDLLDLLNSDGGMTDFLQALADSPPEPNLPYIVFLLASIRPQSPGYNPELFLTKGRPFVNRSELRQHVEQLKNAAAGPDSVLVIGGGERTGKTHGVRYVKFRMPDTVPVDIADWQPALNLDGKPLLDAIELARAITRYAEDFRGCDPDKEDAQLPGLVDRLVTQLNRQADQYGAPLWIAIDSCERNVSTPAARQLLKELVKKVVDGHLPKIRLILACAESEALFENLHAACRRDMAVLPTATHIEQWCERVAAQYQRPAPGTFSAFAARVATAADLENQLMAFYRSGGVVP